MSVFEISRMFTSSLLSIISPLLCQDNIWTRSHSILRSRICKFTLRWIFLELKIEKRLTICFLKRCYFLDFKILLTPTRLALNFMAKNVFTKKAKLGNFWNCIFVLLSIGDMSWSKLIFWKKINHFCTTLLKRFCLV